jgi:hypothetical protein
MVQILGPLFVHAEESETEFGALADVGVGLVIDVIYSLGTALTLLPAGPSHPGFTAGPSFLQASASAPPVLTNVSSALERFSSRLATVQP